MNVGWNECGAEECEGRSVCGMEWSVCGMEWSECGMEWSECGME